MSLPQSQISLAGGRRDIDHPTRLKEDQFSDSLNLEIRGTSLGKGRRGSETRATGGSGYVQAGGYFRKSPGVGFVLKVQGGILYYWANSGNVWKQVGSVTLANTDSPVSLVPGFVDGVSGTALLIFQGNGSPVCYWDGDTGTSIVPLLQGTTDPVQGDFAVAHPSGRICVIGYEPAPDHIYFSGLFDHGNAQWDSTNLIKRIYTSTGDEVRAIRTYRKNELLAWTDSTLHILGSLNSAAATSFTRETLDDKIGIKAAKSAVVSGEDAFFMSQDLHIRSLKRSPLDVAYGVSTPISHFNNQLIQTINKLHSDGVTSTIFDNYLLIAFPKDDSPVNDRVLVFDLLYFVQLPTGGVAPICIGEWSNWYVHDWIVANFNNEERLFWVDENNGNLVEGLVGETDGGDWIETSVTLRGMNWGNGDLEKIARYGIVKYHKSYGSLLIEVADDSGDFQTVETITVDSGGPVVGTAVVGTSYLGTPVTDEEPFYFFGFGRSKWWQLRLTGTNGVWNFREITMYSDVVHERSGSKV